MSAAGYKFQDPDVAAAVEEIEARFGEVGNSYPGHDDETNSIEYAADFWSLDRNEHDRVLNWLKANDGANARRIGATYIVTFGRIWSYARRSEGVRRHSGASSSNPSVAHKNHYHISFRKGATYSPPPDDPREETDDMPYTKAELKAIIAEVIDSKLDDIAEKVLKLDGVIENNEDSPTNPHISLETATKRTLAALDELKGRPA